MRDKRLLFFRLSFYMSGLLVIFNMIRWNFLETELRGYLASRVNNATNSKSIYELSEQKETTIKNTFEKGQDISIQSSSTHADLPGNLMKNNMNISKGSLQGSLQESLQESSTKVATKASTEISKDTQCVQKRVSTANAQTLQTKEERRRRILYIHPGPPKTATSTIQKLLTEHQAQLQRDNIFYLGKTMPREKWNCNFPHMSWCITYQQYGERAEGKNVTCVHSMRDQLDAYYRMGADVIVSDEVIGAMFTVPEGTRQGKRDLYKRAKEGLKTLFSEVLRTNDWEIRIMIGYRPYFDFLTSSYHQEYKARGKQKLHAWPGQGGTAIPSLDQDILQGSQPWQFSDKLVEVFRPYADRVDVFDITTNADASRGDLSERFFCDLLEDAHEVCSFFRDNSRKEIRMNVAVSLEYDRIATAAAEQGLVNKTAIMRKDVNQQAHAFWKDYTSRTPGAKLPLVCPPQNRTTILYSESLQHEMFLFPNRKPNWETRQLFDTMMREQKLCSVDLERVLQTKEWKEFFRSMKPSTA